MQTLTTIQTGLHNLGVCPGMTLLVHTSLSSFGCIYGGVQGFECKHDVSQQSIGESSCRLFRVRDAVDFAVKWLNNP